MTIVNRIKVIDYMQNVLWRLRYDKVGRITYTGKQLLSFYIEKHPHYRECSLYICIFNSLTTSRYLSLHLKLLIILVGDANLEKGSNFNISMLSNSRTPSLIYLSNRNSNTCS